MGPSVGRPCQQSRCARVPQPWRHRPPAALTALALAGLLCGLALPARAISNSTPTTAFAPVGFFGVQVAPDWVVTANHVAAAFFPIGSGTIDFGNGLGTRTVIDRFDAPGSTGFPANDLTLLRLAPGSGPGAGLYLPLASDLYASGSFGALPVTIAASDPALQRRYGFSTVSAFAQTLDPDDDGPLGPVQVNYLLSFDTSVYVQPGDSGGGVFWGHLSALNGAASPLLGLASAQLGEAAAPEGSAFVLLAAYRDWIDLTLASAPGNTQQLQWVSVVPEPATALLWSLGLAAVGAAAVRRRRA